jgi:hypothetical protein
MSDNTSVQRLSHAPQRSGGFSTPLGALAVALALLCLLGCGQEQGPAECHDCPEATMASVTMAFKNTLATAQRFDASATLRVWPNPPASTWSSGTVMVGPGETVTLGDVLQGPLGARIDLDAHLLTDDPAISSGRGQSITASTTHTLCTISTTGLPAPNGLTVDCVAVAPPSASRVDLTYENQSGRAVTVRATVSFGAVATDLRMIEPLSTINVEDVVRGHVGDRVTLTIRVLSTPGEPEASTTVTGGVNRVSCRAAVNANGFPAVSCVDAALAVEVRQ